MTSYNDLQFLPTVIAKTVCETPYIGRETNNLSAEFIAQTEAARQAMSVYNVEAFGEFCDRRCRMAYNTRASWFMRCVRAKGNKGRDILYMWITHWLAAYLQDESTLT